MPPPGSIREIILVVFLTVGVVSCLGEDPVRAQTREESGQAVWERTVKSASDEGKLVISIPPSPELRKGIEEYFARRYGVATELVPARGAQVIRRIAEEARAGIRYFDLHMGGSESIVKGLLPANILEPVEPWLILPEVREARNWWGGHMWVDRAKRFVYNFSAYQTATIWHNTRLRGEAIRSLDDFLNPKWKGLIGFSDPRVPGSGSSMWSYMWEVKGEEYLRKLVAQKIMVVADTRLLAENLARGNVALAVGIGYGELLPFMNAGLPVKALATPKEGLYATGGYGNLTIIKNAPHPNATRLFVNWLLAREGQEVFTQSMGSATRRLDVKTEWLKKFLVVAAKDELTVGQYFKMENQSEEKIIRVRDPAVDLARRLLD
jgi:iron(III) transport system substrate-binding protein